MAAIWPRVTVPPGEKAAGPVPFISPAAHTRSTAPAYQASGGTSRKRPPLQADQAL